MVSIPEEKERSKNSLCHLEIIGALLNRSCLAGTVVGWLVPMVRWQVQAWQGQNGATDYCPAQDPQQQRSS